MLKVNIVFKDGLYYNYLTTDDAKKLKQKAQAATKNGIFAVGGEFETEGFIFPWDGISEIDWEEIDESELDELYELESNDQLFSN